MSFTSGYSPSSLTSSFPVVHNLPDAPNVGSVSPDIFRLFRGLNSVNRKFFKRIYRAVWAYLWPVSRFHDMAHVFLLPDVLRNLNGPKITLIQFILLSRCWVLSNSGKVAFKLVEHTELSNTDYLNIRVLVDAGLLLRSHHDPGKPYSLRLYHASWLYFSGAGVVYYKKVLGQYRKAIEKLYLNMVYDSTKKPTR